MTKFCQRCFLFSKKEHIIDTIGSIDELIEGKEKENILINRLIQKKLNIIKLNNEKIKIGELPGYTIIKSGIVKFDDTKIYLDTASVNEYGISSSDYIVTYKEKPSRANMQPIPNSIWFAKLKDSPKYLFVQEYMQDILSNYIFSTGFLGLEAKNKYIANYFYALITSDEFDDNKNRLSIGATMQGINNETFKEILVPNLSLDEMEKFGIDTDNLLQTIYENKCKINKLKDLKNLYLKKFFG